LAGDSTLLVTHLHVTVSCLSGALLRPWSLPLQLPRKHFSVLGFWGTKHASLKSTDRHARIQKKSKHSFCDESVAILPNAPTATRAQSLFHDLAPPKGSQQAS